MLSSLQYQWDIKLVVGPEKGEKQVWIAKRISKGRGHNHLGAADHWDSADFFLLSLQSHQKKYPRELVGSIIFVLDECLLCTNPANEHSIVLTL